MEDLDVIPSADGELEEKVEYPWLQMEHEPDVWYRRFAKYYIALGPARTLLKAMMAYYQTEEPSQYELILMNPRQSASSDWSKMSNLWMWRFRAREYDRIRYMEAQGVIDQARTTIVENTNKAALALVEALENPRLKVAAAKEILDRGGIPGVAVRESRVVPFSADELAKAHREVSDWERQLQQKSESSG